jgi:hypothetical protein
LDVVEKDKEEGGFTNLRAKEKREHSRRSGPPLLKVLAYTRVESCARVPSKALDDTKTKLGFFFLIALGSSRQEIYSGFFLASLASSPSWRRGGHGKASLPKSHDPSAIFNGAM